MQFKFLLTVAAAATASAGVARRQADVGDFSNALKDIADSITDGIETIKDIQPGNIGQVLPKLAGNFNDITKTISNFGKAVGNIKPSDIPNTPGSSICDTYSDFFDVYNRLVDVVIGKDGLLARIPATVIALPIAGLLQVANSAINNFVFSFIKLLPNCRERAQQELEEANKKFQDAIEDFGNNVYTPLGGNSAGQREG